MLSIDYIWSAFAITQALIATLHVGSKLLLPQQQTPAINQQQQQQLSSGENIGNSTDVLVIIEHNDTTTKDIRPSQLSPVEKTQQQLLQENIDTASTTTNDDNDDDLLLRAFQLAVRIGSVQFDNHNSTTSIELRYDDDDRTTTTQPLSHRYNSNSSTSRCIHVQRCFSKTKPLKVVEPYRMSMVPVDATRPTSTFSTIQNTSNDRTGSLQLPQENKETTHDSHQNETTTSTTSTTFVATTVRPEALQVVNDAPIVSVSATDGSINEPNSFKEYYEAHCRLIRNTKSRSTTTTARIRAYAPQLFQQLRSYYDDTGADDHTTNRTTTTNGRRHSEKQLQQQQLSLKFTESLLQRSFTFLKTNSKGSQRSKNVFFYTTSSTTTTKHRPHTTPRRSSSSPASFNHDKPNVVSNNYLIKSIMHDEFHTMMDTILPNYVPYMKQYGSVSLINRIYGIYEITLNCHDDDDDDDEQTQHLYSDDIDVANHIDNDTVRKQPHQKQQRYYLVIFNAVFDPSLTTASTTARKKSSFHVYDIKGSTVGRQAKKSTNNITNENCIDPQTQGDDQMSSSSSITYKDLDLLMDLKINNDSNAVDESNTTTSAATLVRMDPVEKQRLLHQLQNDVNFLTCCSVMDYSFLIGIEYENIDERRKISWELRNNFWRKRLRRNRKDDGYVSPLSVHYGTTHNGHPVKYYFGLIDFLQPYNYKKDIEYRIKGLLYARNTYSCIPPHMYAERFMDFVGRFVV